MQNDHNSREGDRNTQQERCRDSLMKGVWILEVEILECEVLVERLDGIEEEEACRQSSRVDRQFVLIGVVSRALKYQEERSTHTMIR